MPEKDVFVGTSAQEIAEHEYYYYVFSYVREVQIFYKTGSVYNQYRLNLHVQCCFKAWRFLYLKVCTIGCLIDIHVVCYQTNIIFKAVTNRVASCFSFSFHYKYGR